MDIITKRTVGFFINTLEQNHCIYNKVVIDRLIQFEMMPECKRHGPVSGLWEICQYCGVSKMLLTKIKNGDTSLDEVKKKIYDKLEEDKKLSLLMMKVTLKSSAFMPDNVQSQDYRWPWWNHCKKHTNQIRAVRQLAILYSSGNALQIYRIQDHAYGSDCALCGQYGAQHLSHILYECNETNDLRQQMRNSVPQNLLTSMDKLSVYERTKFIMNGFNVMYVHEWQDIYNAILIFVNTCYNRIRNVISLT